MRLRADWRLAAVGAAAAITVAAVLGTQLGDAAAPSRSGPASTTGTLRLDSPAEVLNRAADALEKQLLPGRSPATTSGSTPGRRSGRRRATRTARPSAP